MNPGKLLFSLLVCRRAWRLEAEPPMNRLRQFGQDGFDSSKAFLDSTIGFVHSTTNLGDFSFRSTTDLRGFSICLGNAGQEGRLVLRQVRLGLKHQGESLLHRLRRLFKLALPPFCFRAIRFSPML